MSMPKFICIGTQKAGTTWLYQMLAQNPDIWLPPLKEVHFFDKFDEPEFKPKRRNYILNLADKIERRGIERGSSGADQPEFIRSLAGDDILTEAWYRRIFSHPDAANRVCGEITPAYLTLDEEKILYFKSLLPDVKLVLIVREPAARNISQLKMSANRDMSDEATDADWKKYLKRLVRLERGEYQQSIPLWQKHFGPEQLLILPFSLIKTDPAQLIAKIETFIGAKPYAGYKSLDEPVHKTKEVEVPDWVKVKAAEIAEPQKQYLVEAFGQDFYEKTR